MGRVSAHAIELAKLTDATIHTLYVVDESAYTSIPDEIRAQTKEALEGDGHSSTKSIAEKALEQSLEVTREIRWGKPAAAIIAYAVENDVDLIVMGTRDKSGFERYMLGSVAEKVVRGSPIPVLTVQIGNLEEMKRDIEEILGY